VGELSVEIVANAALRRRVRNVGLLLTAIGILGVILPQVISITLSLLVGVLLIGVALLTGYAAWYGYTQSRLVWLQPAILLLFGLLILMFPTIGTAVIGLLLTVFFLLDGFYGISFGLALRPLPGWLWPLLSGAAALLIAIVFIAGWPFEATWLVGLFIGISLLLDGIALLLLSYAARS